MKHIKTESEEEARAKADFAKLESEEPMVADVSVESAVHRLYTMMKQADANALEMSRLRGTIMCAMKGHAYLKNKDGFMLCSWVAGNASQKTDWKGLCEKYKVTESDKAAFTKTSVGARRFSVEFEGGL